MSKFSLAVIYLSMLCFSAKSQSTPEYFDLEELSLQNGETEGAYLPFIDNSSLRMGLYELTAGGLDRQEPHRKDEIYYIANGKASLSVGEEVISVKPGSIVYVKARVPHRFIDISEDLRVLVIFSNAEPSSGDPDWLAFALSELIKKRRSNEDIRSQFLDTSTLQMDLHLFAESSSGEEGIKHSVDEINIVVGGTGKFVSGDEIIDLESGSILFIPKETGYRFQKIGDKSPVILTFRPKKINKN